MQAQQSAIHEAHFNHSHRYLCKFSECKYIHNTLLVYPPTCLPYIHNTLLACLPTCFPVELYVH